MQVRPLVLLTVLLLASASGAPALAQTAGQSANIREMQTQQLPKVLKGSAIKRRAPAKAATAGEWQTLAGRHLWLVNAGSGEVATCRLRDTTQVGKEVIRCFRANVARRLKR